MNENEFGQPIGPDLDGWTAPEPLGPVVLSGRHVSLEPMRPGDGAALFEALRNEPDSLWTYMTIGPFDDPAEMAAAVADMTSRSDWHPFVVRFAGAVHGFLSYLRIDNAGGVIEIGSIVFDATLQRTTAATEAIFLLIDHAFAMGFRRVEWKCDDLNEPSIRAAKRFGFDYEGTFRSATHYKGRNRDTAWFAIVAEQWPELRQAYLRWLLPSNFDDSGSQLVSFGAMRSGSRPL